MMCVCAFATSCSLNVQNVLENVLRKLALWEQSGDESNFEFLESLLVRK